MKRHSENWNEFLNQLQSNATQQYEETKEYEYWQLQYAEIDMLLRDNLREDQKEMVDDCIYQIGMAAEREAQLYYRQGLKDCMWLLKTLGVLA